MDKAIGGRFSFLQFFGANWPFFLIGVPFTVFGVVVIAHAIKGPPNPRENVLWQYLGGLTCLLFGVPSLWFAAVAYIQRTRWLIAGPDGIMWSSQDGEGSASWGDIQTLYREDSSSINGPRLSQVRITFKGGTELTFRESLSNYYNLANVIQQQAAQVVLLEKSKEISKVGEAEFGIVGVGPRGLRIEKTVYPWEAINYGVSEGCLAVVPDREDFKIEERLSVLLGAIPDYLALLLLMEQFGKAPIAPALTYPKSWRRSIA